MGIISNAQQDVAPPRIASAPLPVAKNATSTATVAAPTGSVATPAQPPVAPAAQTTQPTPAMQLGTPAQVGVGQDQTVAGQMQKMADPNDPYFQKWAAAGTADAASRGFTGNSSIQQTGILNSVMQNATPIAAADAATYDKNANTNANTQNQFSLANQQAGTAQYTADKSAQTQLGVTGMNNTTALAQTKLGTDSQAAISQAHDANSVLLANNQQASQAYNNYVVALAQIDQNGGMDVSAKAAAINHQTQVFNSAINSIKAATPSSPAVTSPLDTSNYQAAVNQAGGVDVSGGLSQWSQNMLGGANNG